jgi:hypothetical protein
MTIKLTTNIKIGGVDYAAGSTYSGTVSFEDELVNRNAAIWLGPDPTAATLSGKGIRRTNLLAYGQKGQFDTIAVGADHCSHVQVTLPHFDRIAIGLFNACPGALVNIRAAVGTSNALGADNSVASITPSDGWSNFLFSAATNVTLPLGTANYPSFTLSDWLDKSSIDAGDTPWAVTHIRIEQPTAGNPNRSQNMTVGGWETPANYNGHVYRQRFQAVLGVTTPASFNSTASFGGGMAPFLILIQSRYAGISIMQVGDSISEWGNGYVWRTMTAQSTPTNPITVCNAAAISGATSTIFTDRFTQLAPAIKPSAVVYAGWAVNDGSASITQGVINGMRANLQKALSACRDYSITPIIGTGSPVNQAKYNWGSTMDALRLARVAEINLMGNRNTGVRAFDTTLAWSGGVSASGQIEFNAAAASGDGLHPTNYAVQVPLFTQVLAQDDA